MARYFLYFHSPQGRVGDPVELVHLGKLHDSVTKVANDFVRDNSAAAEWTFEVRDETGRNVLSDKLGKFVTADKPTS